MAQGKVLASTADGPTEIADIRGRGIQFKRPDRQQGIWSFLTWSFFLAEVMAGAQFLTSGSAKASQDGNDAAHRTSHSGSSDDGASGNPDPAFASSDDGASRATLQSEAQAALGGGVVNDVGHSAHRGASDPASGAAVDGAHGGASSSSDAGASAQGSSTSEGALQSGSEACGQTWGGCSHDWYCLQPEATPGSPGGSQLPEINPGFGFGILPIIDTATGLGQNLADHVHGSAAAVSQLVDTTLEHLTGPNLHEAVTGLTTNLGDVATSTLSQVTGLQLGGLTGDLSGLVGDTLSQITGLHLGAVTGEATAFIDGSLDPGLSVTLGAADSLIAQVGGGAASNVEALVSPIADLGFLVSGEDSNGLVWQPVDTLLSEVSGKQIVADAGNAIDSALSPEDALTAGDSGSTALNVASGFTQLGSLGSEGDVASGGTIALTDAIGGNVTNDLFTAGRYTDYGLALQSDTKSDVTATADTLISATDDSVSGSLPLLDSHTPLAQDVDTTLAHSSTALSDLGRDLSI